MDKHTDSADEQHYPPAPPSFLYSVLIGNRGDSSSNLLSTLGGPWLGMCMVGRNQGWQIKAELLNGKVLLPVALFAAWTPEAIAPPPGGLSVTDGTVVGSSVKGAEEAPPQSHLLNSMN